MSLGNKQREFTRCISYLIAFAYLNGYELTFGDAYRCPQTSHGHPKSCHRNRLAVDFNLFKDGVWLKDSEDHKALGAYWESLHPLARWGGRFRDGNHYSFEHEGMQ